MGTITAFIGTSVEARQFGWNAGTFFALGAFFVSFLQAYGAWKLLSAILQKKSAVGVSLPMISYWNAFLWIFMLYGIHTKSLVMVANISLGGPIYLLILIGLLYYGRVTAQSLVIVILPIVFLGTVYVLSTDKSVPILVFMLGGLLFNLDQPRVLWKERCVGSYTPHFTISMMVASAFWFFFAWLVAHDVALMVVNPTSFAVGAFTLYAYARAKKYEALKCANRP